MSTVLGWMVVGTICLGAFVFLILTPLAWVVGIIRSVVVARAERTHASTASAAAPVRTPSAGAMPGAARPRAAGGNTDELDIAMGMWAKAIAPYTAALASLLRQYRPMIETHDDQGLSGVATALLAELDEMDVAVPAAPTPEAATHWAAMTTLLRQACAATLDGVRVTRDLTTVSAFLEAGTKESLAVADLLDAWTRDVNARLAEP